MRKIKIRILNLPFRLHSPKRLSQNSISQNGKINFRAVDPNETTHLRQEKEGLITNMRCTRIKIEQSSFRWNTCSTRLQNPGQTKPQLLHNILSEVPVYKEKVEMNHIPIAEKFETCSNQESDSDKFYSVASSIPIPERHTTLLFVSDSLYEPLIKSEDEAPVGKIHKNNSLSNIPSLLRKRRNSECYTNPLINAHIIEKQKIKYTSKSYGNMFQIRRNSMLFVLDNYINTSCVY